MKNTLLHALLLIALFGCGQSHVGTETGNPPVVSPSRIYLTVEGDGHRFPAIGADARADPGWHLMEGVVG